MLEPLQERLAILISQLPEADGFALMGGAALFIHRVIERPTQDLDYARPAPDVGGIRVHVLAAAIDRVAADHGLAVTRLADVEQFIRLAITDSTHTTEVDLTVDYRALDPVDTPLGPTLDLKELGANKVLAIFDRAEPRDFTDLAAITGRYDLSELVQLAAQKDLGLDLGVLDERMGQLRRLPREDFPVNDDSYALLAPTVDSWRTSLQEIARGAGRELDH